MLVYLQSFHRYMQVIKLKFPIILATIEKHYTGPQKTLVEVSWLENDTLYKVLTAPSAGGTI